MTSSENAPEQQQALPIWLTASAEGFARVDGNQPLNGLDTVDCLEISEIYFKAAKASESAGENVQQSVFAMIGAIAGFHFVPSSRNEPFGPMWRSSEGRSAIPSDFKGEPEKILSHHVAGFANPALRARIADTLWILDRSRAFSGTLALTAYSEVARLALTGAARARFREAEIDFHLCADHLRRGLFIARAIGWEREESNALKALVIEAREKAFVLKDPMGFALFAELDLDFSISPPADISTKSERLAGIDSDYHRQNELWTIAARGFAYAKNDEERTRCQREAAESLVKISEGANSSAMFEAHWLEQAIALLHRIPKTQNRRKELKHRLVDVQSRITEEMSPFSQEMDLSKFAEEAQKAVGASTSLYAALGEFAKLGFPPTPERLEEEAKELIGKHPLQSLFSSAVVDPAGRPIHRYEGGDPTGAGEQENSATQRQIVQAESIRRTVMVGGSVEPARLEIMTQYHVVADNFLELCQASPFIPQTRQETYAIGFAKFFQGEFTSALYILVPQLENSVRYVLAKYGFDVTKLNADMTQEYLNLSVLLDRLRAEMNTIFTPRFVTDIDNVFDHRGGPNIRNQVAHGMLPDGAPFAPDAIYACWLILQLTCLPLFSQWSALTQAYEAKYGRRSTST